MSRDKKHPLNILLEYKKNNSLIPRLCASGGNVETLR